MNTTEAYFEEEQCLHDSTLSALQWFAPRFSTFQNELDQLHHTWQIQKEAKIFTELKYLIKTESKPPSWLSEAVTELNSLLALADNWDSYGACRISQEAAFAAIQVLHFVMEEKTPLPSVVPTSLGGIQLEWHRFGIDLEVEITPSRSYSISYEDETEETESYEDDSPHHSAYNPQPLFNFVNRITQRADMED